MNINMKKIAKPLAAAATLVALALPIGWALGPASAETAPTTTTVADDTTTDATTDTSTDTTTAPAKPTKEERQAKRAARREERQKELAEKLGVTPQELKDARLSVLSDRLDEAVANGRITQERADQIRDAAKAGTLPELRRELRRERHLNR